MPANDRMPSAWSRRSFLVALMAGSVTALAGCRVRLEDDAPRIPGLPTRQLIPDEKALLSARWDALRLKEIASGLGGLSTPLTRRLAVLHGQQVDVLEAVLSSGGVPAAVIKAAIPTTPGATNAATPTWSAPASTTSATSGPAPVSGLAGLVSAEAEALSAQALAGLANVSKDRVGLLGCMTAQRGAAVLLLGGRLPDTGAAGTTGPTGPTGPTGGVAAAQLDAFRAAVYGFEVVVSQTGAARRKAAANTLQVLRATSSDLEQLAGSAAGPTPLGYALPFPVSTPDAAMRLATHLMTGLREAIASQLPVVIRDGPGLPWTVHALADACVQAVAWRVPLTAFPGLTSP